MDYNTSFTYSTWDKVYVKFLAAVVEQPNCTWKDIAIRVYGNPVGRNRDVLTGLIYGHAIYISGYGKHRACLYDATPAGKELYNTALATKPLCEALEFAKKYNDFTEFQLNTVLAGKAEMCENSFFTRHINPMLLSEEKVMKHLKNKFSALPFFNEWKDWCMKH